MARPIRATPRLSGKASYDFQQTLSENEEKKIVVKVEKPAPHLEKKILDDAPMW